MTDFERKLRVGQQCENAVFAYKRRHGAHILRACDLPASQFAGPRLSSTHDLVVPDGMIFDPSDGTHWGEVKGKKHWTWHRMSGTWQTGIDKLCFDRYGAIRNKTATPVILYFLQCQSAPWPPDIAQGCPPKCPTGLYFINLDVEPDHHHRNWGKGGMVYWREDQFQYRVPLNEIFPLFAANSNESAA